MSRPDANTTDARAWDPSGDDDPRRNRCQNCGDYIDHDTGRVFGGNDDLARKCLGCACTRELRQGAAAGKDAMPARTPTPSNSGGQRGESL